MPIHVACLPQHTVVHLSNSRPLTGLAVIIKCQTSNIPQPVVASATCSPLTWNIMINLPPSLSIPSSTDTYFSTCYSSRTWSICGCAHTRVCPQACTHGHPLQRVMCNGTFRLWQNSCTVQHHKETGLGRLFKPSSNKRKLCSPIHYMYMYAHTC